MTHFYIRFSMNDMWAQWHVGTMTHFYIRFSIHSSMICGHNDTFIHQIFNERYVGTVACGHKHTFFHRIFNTRFNDMWAQWHILTSNFQCTVQWHMGTMVHGHDGTWAQWHMGTIIHGPSGKWAQQFVGTQTCTNSEVLQIPKLQFSLLRARSYQSFSIFCRH